MLWSPQRTEGPALLAIWEMRRVTASLAAMKMKERTPMLELALARPKRENRKAPAP